MFKVYHIFSGILLLLIGSCNTRQEELSFYEPQFKDTVEIKGQILNNSFIMGYGDDIDFYNDILIVNAYKGTEEEAIHFFNTNNGLHIKSILPKGRGPGEALVTRDLDINHETGEVLFYDFMGHKLCHFNIDSVLKHDNHKDYVECNPYPIYMYTIHQGKNCYIATGGNILPTKERTRFSIINNDTVTYNYSSFPKVSIPGVPNGIAISYNYCHADVSPDKSKIVCTSGYGGILEIFNIHQDKITLKTIKGFYKPIFDTDKNEIIIYIPNKTFSAFKDLYVTDKYIYTIFDIIPESRNQKNIAVFDWEGNSIRLYQCDYNLHKICIDSNNNKVYAIGRNEDEETMLVEFYLK